MLLTESKASIVNILISQGQVDHRIVSEPSNIDGYRRGVLPTYRPFVTSNNGDPSSCPTPDANSGVGLLSDVVTNLYKGLTDFVTVKVML